MNIIRTDGADELVVLTRAEYDALVERATGAPFSAEEEAAEEAWAVRAYDEAMAALARGDDVALPSSVWESLEAGASPVLVLREWRKLTRPELAAKAGVDEQWLAEIESGAPPEPERLRPVATALGVPLDLLAA